MEQINYEKLIPQEPITDVVAFAQQQGEFENAYMIYRSERVYDPLNIGTVCSVKVTCSACGHTFYAEKVPAGGCRHSYAPAPFGWRDEQMPNAVIDGDKTLCPSCYKEAKTVHVGSMRAYGGELIDDAWVTELSRLPVEGLADRLVLTEWCIRRCINKQGTVRYEIWPFTAWVVEEKKIVRLMGYLKNIGGRIHLFGEWRQRKQFEDVYGSAKLIVPWDKSLLEGTTAENSKLDLYQTEKRGRELVSYLALWRRRPYVENLLVQGCGNLVRTWIKKEMSSGYYKGGIPKLEAVNWKEKRPAQMLGLTKDEFRQMKQARWSAEDLEKYKLVRNSGVPVRLPEDMELLRKVENYDCSRILEEAPKSDFWRTIRYLIKQKEHWYTLQDYRNMARNAGRDMTDNLVQWPRNLTAAHNRYVEERQARWDKEEKEKRAKEIAERSILFAERAVELEWLSFKAGGLLIRPCASEDELIQEGRELHHCVSSYAKSHAEGKTAILFIRQAKAPDKPFFTLEFDEKNLTVVQNRGLRNCDRTPEVAAFEKAWLEQVRQIKVHGRIRVA
ncbi:MAG: hypothetical protein HFF62_05975 [Oscillospiraceae bacterium]|nr:hypothetical protein [Oscillospiraceae bacterium]